jgi:hypothetical protein
MFNNISRLTYLMMVSGSPAASCKYCGCYPPIIITNKKMITDLYTMANTLKGICMSRNCTQAKSPEERMRGMAEVFESSRIRLTQDKVSFQLANVDEYYLTLHWLDEIKQRASDTDSDVLIRIIHTDILLSDWFKWLHS